MPVIQGVSFPDSSQIGPLSVVTWPSTVAHTLVATTGAQTIYDKTLADNVKLITASTANPIPLGAITWPSTAAHTLTATTVVQTLEHKTFSVGVGMSLVTASTSTPVPNYGHSFVASPAAGGGKNNYTLAPPDIGVVKIFSASGTANSSDYANIYTGSTAIFIEAAGRPLSDLYVGLQQDRATVILMGRTTAIWLALGTIGTVAFSTA